MTTTGTVRFWLADEGWGVVDSPDTPGGCWTHFSAVAVAGYTTLEPGEQVGLEWETADQDGYAYRALRTWPAEVPPVDVDVDQPAPSGAYRSTLTITYDEPIRRQ